MKRMDKISRLRDSVSEKVFKVLFLEKQLPVDDVSKRGIRAPSAAASGRFAQVDPHLKFREFRFAIAFENRKINWYITEKLVNAFLGGTIPLYWGAKEVLDVFNPEAFIYFDYNNPTPALKRLEYLERNRTAYDLALQACRILSRQIRFDSRLF